MTMLDEAMAGNLAGEYRRLDTVVFATCNLLAACQLIGDIERAIQGCKAAEAFMESYGSPFLHARCRVHYGGLMVAKGHWELADDQLQAALAMASDTGRGIRTDALVQLADLRLRQGRLEEAEALIASAGDSADAALPAAALRLARGEPAVAARLLERRTRLLGEDHIEVGATLAMLAQAHLDDGDLPAAVEVAGRLQSVAERQQRGAAAALAVLASAQVAEAAGDRQGAIAQLESALGAFAQLDLPDETARVRLALARLLADQNPRLAASEAQTALVRFDRLGAAGDADAAMAVLRTLGITPRRAPRTASPLTAREQEVLNLVGLGLSNPEIAARLYISRKTAAHHVSAVLTKLGLRNRAEAVAYVTRHPEAGAASSGRR